MQATSFSDIFIVIYQVTLHKMPQYCNLDLGGSSLLQRLSVSVFLHRPVTVIIELPSSESFDNTYLFKNMFILKYSVVHYRHHKSLQLGPILS